MGEYMFETILFINQVPCYYKVYHFSGFYLYEPLPHHFYNTEDFPELVVNKSNEKWNVMGTSDLNMVGPLIRELEDHILVKSDQQ